MSLTLSLNNALSGLIAEQRALGVVSQNITNAKTEGYTRRVVNFEAQHLDPYEMGVKIGSIERTVDYYMVKALQNKNSDVGLADVKAEYFDKMQLVFGGPGDGNSIDAYMQDYFSALQDLAASPESSSLKYLAVSSGIQLATAINTTAAEIEQLRFEADGQITDAVGVINQELMKLYNINVALNTAHGTGNDANGLQDERDAAINTLSEYMDVSYYFEESGAVQVYTGPGIALVGYEPYQLSYAPVGGVDVLIGDGPVDALTVYPSDLNGNAIGAEVELTTDNGSGTVTSYLKSGRLQGLLELRDFDFNNTLAQLDMLAATLREEVNAAHNDGAGFPAPSVLTSTREMTLGSLRSFEGQVRIGVVGETGNSLSSHYATENGGFRPLTLDFATLDSGNGDGIPSVESIIKEINYHFGIPTSKTSLSNMNDIRLVSLEQSVAGGTFEFDLELENIDIRDSDLTILNITVDDDGAANIDTVTPTTTLGANPIATTNNTNVITVTNAAHTFSVGDKVTLSGITGPLNNIPASELNGTHVITAVTGTTYSYEVLTNAGATGAGGGAAVVEAPPYTTVTAGEKVRSKPDGTFTVDFSGNAGSTFYTINIDVMVDDGTDGGQETATISFTVPNGTTDNLNDRFFATAVPAGTAVIDQPAVTSAYMRAMLVDENGIEIQTGSNDVGFLQLEATDSTYMIAIDELDSNELGDPSIANTETNRGFSHFFELNNFFVRNTDATDDQDTTNSAINLEVRADIVANPNYISTGELSQSTQPSPFQELARYDYELGTGNNVTASALAAVGIENVSFQTAGQLPALNMSLVDYSAEIIGFASVLRNTADATLSKEEFLREGFAERVEAISGVNIDEELANTILFQNAYAAAARVVTVTDEMFETLIASF